MGCSLQRRTGAGILLGVVLATCCCCRYGWEHKEEVATCCCCRHGWEQEEGS